jgi:hypothetical protein
VPCFAQIAAPTRKRRINGYPLANMQRVIMSIARIRPGCRHNAREFVAQHQRVFDYRIANAAIGIGVQVRAAYPHRLYAQQNFSGLGRVGFGNCFYPHIAGTV